MTDDPELARRRGGERAGRKGRRRLRHAPGRKPKGPQYATSRGNHERADIRRAALRQALAIRNLSVKEVADLVVAADPTISQSHRQQRSHAIVNAISNFLNERSITLHFDTAEPLANALGITLNELVGWPTPAEPPQAIIGIYRGEIVNRRDQIERLTKEIESYERAIAELEKGVG